MATTTPITTTSSNSTSSSSTSTANSQLNLSTTDFLNMMMTQLENQDPLNPTSTDDLMQETSEIGQMQSTTALQSTLTNLATQSQIGSASSLMGKQITGLDANSDAVAGSVSSVQVASTGVSLTLDNGSVVSLDNVTSISPAATTSTQATGS